MGCGSSQDATTPSATKPIPATVAKPAPPPKTNEIPAVKLEANENTQHRNDEPNKDIKYSEAENGEKAESSELKATPEAAAAVDDSIDTIKPIEKAEKNDK